MDISSGVWRNLWGIASAAVVLMLAGCGSEFGAEVSGVVTLDGIPLENGIVAFHPEHGGPVAHGVIGKDGSYVVLTGRQEGLPIGDYTVTVVANETPRIDAGSGPPPPGRRLTSEKVSDKSTTDLHYNVESGHNQIDLNLRSQD